MLQKLRVFLCSLIECRMCIINLLGKVGVRCNTCYVQHPHTQFSCVQPLTFLLACVAMLRRMGNSADSQRNYQRFEWISKCSSLGPMQNHCRCSLPLMIVFLQGQEYTLPTQTSIRNSRVGQSRVCSLGKHTAILIEM